MRNESLHCGYAEFDLICVFQPALNAFRPMKHVVPVSVHDKRNDERLILGRQGMSLGSNALLEVVRDRRRCLVPVEQIINRLCAPLAPISLVEVQELLLDLLRLEAFFGDHNSEVADLARPEEEPGGRFEDAQRRALSQRGRGRKRLSAHRAGADLS